MAQSGFGGKQEPEIVYIALNPLEADLVVALLESEGIPAFTAGAAASQAFGLAIGPLAEVRVLVSAVHAERAEQIIAERHLREGEDAEPVEFEEAPPGEDPEFDA